MATRIDLWAKSPIRSHRIRHIRSTVFTPGISPQAKINRHAVISAPRQAAAAWTADLWWVWEHLLPRLQITPREEAPDKAELMRIPAHLWYEAKQCNLSRSLF